MKVKILSADNMVWYGKHIGEIFDVERSDDIYRVINNIVNDPDGSYAVRIIRYEDCITIDAIRDNKLNELGI